MEGLRRERVRRVLINERVDIENDMEMDRAPAPENTSDWNGISFRGGKIHTLDFRGDND